MSLANVILSWLQFNWPNFNKEQERLANVKLSSKSSRDRLHTVMKYCTEGVLVMNEAFLNAACNAITMWLACRNSKRDEPDNYNWTTVAWGGNGLVISQLKANISPIGAFFGLELIPSSKLTKMVSFKYLVMVYIREDL